MIKQCWHQGAWFASVNGLGTGKRVSSDSWIYQTAVRLACKDSNLKHAPRLCMDYQQFPALSQYTLGTGICPPGHNYTPERILTCLICKQHDAQGSELTSSNTPPSVWLGLSAQTKDQKLPYTTRWLTSRLFDVGLWKDRRGSILAFSSPAEDLPHLAIGPSRIRTHLQSRQWTRGDGILALASTWLL